MSFPTVECVICHQTVSKRSTLSLAALSDITGRACRTHPQVVAALEAKAKADEYSKSLQKAGEALAVMSGVAAVRVMRTFFNWPLEAIYQRLRLSLPKSLLDQVRAEVDKKGDIMPSEEILDTAAMATLIAGRKGQL